MPSKSYPSAIFNIYITFGYAILTSAINTTALVFPFTLYIHFNCDLLRFTILQTSITVYIVFT